MFATTDLQRIALSLLGAVALGAGGFAATISPAPAAAAGVTARTALASTTTIAVSRTSAAFGPATGLVGAVRY